MKQIKCELCGSTDFVKEDGFFVCQYCGAKYSAEEAKKMMIEGTVDVSGSTVKVDSTDDLDNWYKIARRARDNGDVEKAEKYYELILEKDPENWEPQFYSSLFRALNSTNAQITYEVNNFGINLADVIATVQKIPVDDEEKGNALEQIADWTYQFAMTVRSSLIEYMRSFTGEGGDFAVKERERVTNTVIQVGDLLALLGTIIESMETSEGVEIWKGTLVEKLWKGAVSVWRSVGVVKPQIVNEKVANLTDSIKKYDTEYQKPADQSGGCYVATAVYGSYDCPEVWTLRRFRDYELAKTWYGRAFVRTYYAISPTLVKWVGHTDWFKQMWKGKLDRMVGDLLSKGYESTPYEDKNW